MGKCTSMPRSPRKLSIQSEVEVNEQEDSIPEIVSAIVSNKAPKDQSKAFIAESLKKHYLFSGLSKEDMEMMFAKLKHYAVPAGEVVFEQGAAGKKFYIIESGKLEVYRNNVKKTVLKEGETTGEMAILTDQARRATIKTSEDSTLWGIGREQFRAAIKVINRKNFTINKEFISNLQLFTRLPDSQLTELTNACVQHDYPDNHRIICEGDEGMLLFIIKEGSAVAKIKGVEKFRISQGEMFGEAVVLGENHIRTISVYTIGPVKVLSISRDSIISIIGENFKEIIYRTQAKNSMSSDNLFRMLSKDIIHNLVDSMEWKYIKPGELGISKEMAEVNVFILCLGSLSGGDKNFSHYEVIGFNPKHIPDEGLIADNEVVLGVFSRNKLEAYTKTSWQKLKSELKYMTFLTKIDMFTGVNLSKLRYIASRVTVQEFDKKEVIYRYNDEAHIFYVLKHGSVEILHNGKILRVLSKYDVFGDRCIEEPIRSNTARALSNCLCLVINAVDFRDIMDDSTRTILKKKKSFLSTFSLNQILMIRQIDNNGYKFKFLTYVEMTRNYYQVNVIAKEFFDNVEKFNQVIQEKNIAMQMEHLFIQKSVKTFSDSRFLYLVYEYIDAMPLSTLLTKKITEDYAKFLAACLTLILEYLHDKDIIYRSLSPQNININANGYPSIWNFYRAKIIKGRTMTLLDDPIYTAPEVSLKNGYTKSIDQWSLGIIIYQLLYCSLPFEIKPTDDPMNIYRKTTTGKLVFPQDSKFIRGNEVIADLLKLTPKDRLALHGLKLSRWLDSIDWERISAGKMSSPFKPEVTPVKQSIKNAKLISLTRYLNVRII